MTVRGSLYVIMCILLVMRGVYAGKRATKSTVEWGRAGDDEEVATGAGKLECPR
jgi:hypothetical protein